MFKVMTNKCLIKVSKNPENYMKIKNRLKKENTAAAGHHSGSSF